MSLFVKITDFQDICPTDKYSIVTLQRYLNELEEVYLVRLLGAELFEEFKTDFEIEGTEPTEQRFIDIWNAFYEDDTCGVRISNGIKKMLVGFISFEFLRDEIVKKNIGGLAQNEQANSIIASFQSSDLLTLHNRAVDTFDSIRWYIKENESSYDGYNGIHMRISIG